MGYKIDLKKLLSPRVRNLPWAVIAVFLFVWTYQFVNLTLGGDDIAPMVFGHQICAGELPSRDFVDHGMPLTIWASALVHFLFGHNFLGEVLLDGTFIAASVTLVFFLSASITAPAESSRWVPG